MVFFLVCFLGFNVIVVCFLCVCHSCKVLKMLVFPNFGVFVRWFILVYLGLEGLGVFVVLVFGFSVVPVLFLFWFCFCFVVGVVRFLFFIVVFCFFEGLRVR